MCKVILVGGGGHARVVSEAIRANTDRFRLIGFVDPSPAADAVATLAVPHLGGDDAISRYPNVQLALGLGEIGSANVRRSVVVRIGPARRWVAIVHPRAYVSPHARLELGVVVLTAAIVHPGVRLAAHVLVNTGAIVEHDVVLGEHVIVSPGAVIGGGAVIDDGAFIGLGAIVRDHVRIGASAVVGMGAVVTRDVPPGVTVGGNPARPIQSRST